MLAGLMKAFGMLILLLLMLGFGGCSMYGFAKFIEFAGDLNAFIFLIFAFIGLLLAALMFFVLRRMIRGRNE